MFNTNARTIFNQIYQQELLKYKEKHGNTLVPKGYEENPSLAYWVATQRKYYNANKLLPERIEKLDEIGFVWDPFEAQWSEYFEQLIQYKKEHGDTLVPQDYGDNPSLGKWVATQRTNYNANTLYSERIEKLNEVGFVWDPHEAQWTKYFELLCQYKAEHGDTLVPIRYEKNPSLGKWVDTQRSNHHANKLSPQRIEKLNEVGFVWDSLEAQWLECFEELKEYKRDHGDTLVPGNYPSNPSLGMWVNTQRHEYRKFMAKKKLEEGKSLLHNLDESEIEKIRNTSTGMTEERIRLLEAEDFIWDYYKHAWEIKYEEMCEWISLNGHGAIRASKKKYNSLARWAQYQRQMYKKYLKGEKIGLPKETEERMEKLKRAGFVFDL
jgi:hypothetical protein